MKIAIPIEEKVMEGKIASNFGRAPYFLVYDTELGVGKFHSNPAMLSQGGAGITAGQTIVDLGAEVLLTPLCGEKAGLVLLEAGVKIYQTDGDGVEKNLEAFQAGTLKELTELHKGFHQHGGR